MQTPVGKSWREANKDYLMARLEPIRQALEHASSSPASAFVLPETPVPANATMEHDAASALDILCSLFNLSPFERDVLLLCTGVEIDSEFAQLCATAQSDSQQKYPTFGLALSILANPYWFALSPVAPLRYWRLIEVEAGRSLISSSLRVDERILHYLVGLSYLDRRLSTLFQPVTASVSLLPSYQKIAHEIVAAWSSSAHNDASNASELPMIQLCSPSSADQRDIAATIGALIEHRIFLLDATTLLTAPAELAEFLHLWKREVALDETLLLLDCQYVEPTDNMRECIIAHVIEAHAGPLIIASRERHIWSQRPALTFDVQKPTPDEQKMLWQTILGEHAATLNGQLQRLVSHFSLNAPSIHAAWAEAQGKIASSEQPLGEETLAGVIWEVCRAQTRSGFADLAERIEVAATGDDLVVPDLQRSILQEIVMHVRQRRQVYESWGFASKTRRGLGISALFVGGSGVGKTMAAEVLADELHLDLYRIDLSMVVSKYIGETEKNLRRIFDAAEEGGAILLFDEADALFGKRSEVKDSHDRYANIEVSYLLQRMEAYQGLAILTTNMKDVLDTAFLRRIRFIVQFPFPNAAQRADIWRRIFPKAAPTEGLDVEKLAQMNIAGGHIRNIALKAAFIAADAGEPIRMQHVLRAARHEYANLEKTLTSAETRGWEL